MGVRGLLRRCRSSPAQVDFYRPSRRPPGSASPSIRTACVSLAWRQRDLQVSAIVTIVPIALATMMEHIGDICRHQRHRRRKLHAPIRACTAPCWATAWPPPWPVCWAAPANTTYGENTGVLALTKVYDPLVIRIAAVFAIILSFCPKFEAHHQHDALRHHRRHLLCAVRHDLRHRRAQRGREPGRLHQQPQPDHRRRHPGLRAGLQLSVGGITFADRRASASTCPAWPLPPSRASCSTPSCPATTTSSTRAATSPKAPACASDFPCSSEKGSLLRGAFLL